MLFNKYKCIYSTTYEYIHTYVHTDTTCVQHVNVGLVQARPNYVSHTLPTKNRHCKISSFALRCSATELLLGRECRDTYNTKTIMSVWNRFCLHHCSISNVFHCSIVYLLFCWHMASLSLQSLAHLLLLPQKIISFAYHIVILR